jgi:diphthine synthase
MLYLIGTGLAYTDLGLRAIAIMKNADKVYLERYTNDFPDQELIEKQVGISIEVLDREKVESDFLVKEAKDKDVVLLIPGDPLTATTHVQLIMDSKQAAVATAVVHNASIYTAVAETGLSLYKFGRTTTLTSFGAESPFEVIEANKKAGLHTLVLLDIGMKVKDAVKQLKKHGYEGIVCNRLGRKDSSFGGDELPACVVVPGMLDDNEKVAVKTLTGISL